MPLSPITYNTIINQVKSWIKSNCKNITNYGNINSVFKPGWSKSETVLKGHGYTGIVKITIASGAVEQAAASNVDNDMNAFISNVCKLSSSDLNKNIPEKDFYHFIQNMISFISTKCVYATSQFSQNEKHLIYVTKNTSYNTTFINISSSIEKKLIEALDVSSLMMTMLTVANQYLRCNQLIYKWTVSGV